MGPWWVENAGNISLPINMCGLLLDLLWIPFSYENCPKYPPNSIQVWPLKRQQMNFQKNTPFNMTYICKSGMYVFSLTRIYYDDWLVAEVLSCMLEFRGFTEAWKFPCFPPAAAGTRSTSRQVRSTSSTTSTAHHQPLHWKCDFAVVSQIRLQFFPQLRKRGLQKMTNMRCVKVESVPGTLLPHQCPPFSWETPILPIWLLWAFLYPSLLRLNLSQIGNLIS